MEWQIVMKDKAYDELFTLMSHIKKINSGNEIGAWLFGDWKIDEGKAKLTIDKFVIPKQKVSSVEVDISPESMIDTVKELGVVESNRIKGHWHIHPFGDGETSWSGTDEEKIDDFMNPQKGREIFVFLLSSLDLLKARVEVRMKTTLLGEQVVFNKTFDDLPVEKEVAVKEENLHLTKLEKRIKEKVEVEKKAPMSSFYGNPWYNDNFPYNPRAPYHESSRHLFPLENAKIWEGGKEIFVQLTNEDERVLAQCQEGTIFALPHREVCSDTMITRVYRKEAAQVTGNHVLAAFEQELETVQQLIIEERIEG